jgi:hypothetical protein
VGGTGQDEVVAKGELGKRPTDWSAAGRYLSGETNNNTPKTADDIWVAPTRSAGGMPYRYPGRSVCHDVPESGRQVADFYQWRHEPGLERGWQGACFCRHRQQNDGGRDQGTGNKLAAGVPQALFDIRLGPNGDSM